MRGLSLLALSVGRERLSRQRETVDAAVRRVLKHAAERDDLTDEERAYLRPRSRSARRAGALEARASSRLSVGAFAVCPMGTR
jgi:Arc/MetJ family transcription regulator